MFSWNPLLFLSRSRRRVSPIRRRTPLAVECLELRCVPATFNVTNLADGGVGTGSLRSAITQSNTTYQNQTNTINLSTGTYRLSLAGAQEDAAATGDLDIRGTQTMVIQGAGAGATVIDAAGLDRVFQVIGSGVNVTFRNLTITGGNIVGVPTSSEYNSVFGGGLRNAGGTVTLERVTVSGNRAAPRRKSRRCARSARRTSPHWCDNSASRCWSPPTKRSSSSATRATA